MVYAQENKVSAQKVSSETRNEPKRMQNTSEKLLQLDQIAARKEHNAIAQMIAALPDSFAAWIECYINRVSRQRL